MGVYKIKCRIVWTARIYLDDTTKAVYLYYVIQFGGEGKKSYR